MRVSGAMCCGGVGYISERCCRTQFLLLHPQEGHNSAPSSKARQRSSSACSNAGSIQCTCERVLQLLNVLQDTGARYEIIAEIRSLVQRNQGLLMPDLSHLDNSIREWLLHGPARLRDHK